MYKITKDENGLFKLEDTQATQNITCEKTSKVLYTQNWVIQYGKKKDLPALQALCERLNLRRVWGI